MTDREGGDDPRLALIAEANALAIEAQTRLANAGHPALIGNPDITHYMLYLAGRIRRLNARLEVESILAGDADCVGGQDGG